MTIGAPALQRNGCATRKIEERAVIGDGAPFDAQLRGLGVQGWSQATASKQTRKTSPLKETPLPVKSCDEISIACEEFRGQLRKDAACWDENAYLLFQLALQAILQLGADLGNFHARADHELAAQEFVRAVFIGEFCDHAAILAVLIPAEAAIGNSFRANVLKTAKNRILLGNLKGFSQDRDFDQAFVGPKNLRRPI
jgi:hypothetical protein